jgi:glycosyltransferase involved in cell wall biosynthesis
MIRGREDIEPKDPQVTVLMAVYNGERFLSEALESILNQTFSDFEFLIINDGSVDGTRELLLSYADPRIRVVDNEQNIGLTKSLNRGLAMARGEYVARQDADDRSHPGRLEKQIEFLRRHPEVVLLGTQARTIDERGYVYSRLGELKAVSNVAIKLQLLFGNPFVHTSTMFQRKKVVEEFGGYNAEYRYNQDFELWSRIIANCRVANLPNVLVDCRRNPFSVTKFTPEKKEAFEINFRMNVGVQRRNIQLIFGDDPRLQDWPVLWALINVPYLRTDGREKADPELLLDMLACIRERFGEIYRGSLSDSEVRSIMAQVCFAIADYFGPRMAKAALKAYCIGMTESPTSAVRHLPRFILSLARLKPVAKRAWHALTSIQERVN